MDLPWDRCIGVNVAAMALGLAGPDLDSAAGSCKAPFAAIVMMMHGHMFGVLATKLLSGGPGAEQQQLHLSFSKSDVQIKQYCGRRALRVLPP